MPQKTKPIQAEFVEFICSQCNQGVYRVRGRVLKSNPRQWEHHCSHCDHTAFLTAVFPMIRYKEKDFMLADEVRFGEQAKPDM